jgi:NADH:ubiquinone oxidoreductase subunit 4 (subunit M)
MNTLLPLFLIPTIGTLIIIIMPFGTKEEKKLGKNIALLTSIITLIESIRL